jgi:hypothetical protein
MPSALSPVTEAGVDVVPGDQHSGARAFVEASLSASTRVAYRSDLAVFTA